MCMYFVIGSRLERSKNSLRKIGPAVTNGGMTTFLSVIVLCGSQTHVFITIFKIFFLTVIFGLFNGVVLLPVILCYLGPNETHNEDKCSKCGNVLKDTKVAANNEKNGQINVTINKYNADKT